MTNCLKRVYICKALYMFHYNNHVDITWSILLFANTDVYITKIYLRTSIVTKRNIFRREYFTLVSTNFDHDRRFFRWAPIGVGTIEGTQHLNGKKNPESWLFQMPSPYRNRAPPPVTTTRPPIRRETLGRPHRGGQTRPHRSPSKPDPTDHRARVPDSESNPRTARRQPLQQ
jgi:hypothetical protein